MYLCTYIDVHGDPFHLTTQGGGIPFPQRMKNFLGGGATFPPFPPEKYHQNKCWREARCLCGSLEDQTLLLFRPHSRTLPVNIQKLVQVGLPWTYAKSLLNKLTISIATKLPLNQEQRQTSGAATNLPLRDEISNPECVAPNIICINSPNCTLVSCSIVPSG